MNTSNSRWRAAAWSLVGLLAAVAFIVADSPRGILAQGGAKNIELDKVTGKIASMEKKGKSVKMKITRDDGGELDLMVGTKIPFVLIAKGDKNFLRAPVVVKTQATQQNNQLFARDFEVFIGIRPPGQTMQDPMRQDVFNVVGVVTAANQEGVQVNLGGGFGTQYLMYEKGVGSAITLNLADPTFAPEGSTITVEGQTKGMKFIPLRAEIKLDTNLNADEVFASDKKKTAKADPKPAAKSKTGKAGKAGADQPAAADTSDPFGLNKPSNSKGAKGAGKDAADKGATDKGATDKGATDKEPAGEDAAKSGDSNGADSGKEGSGKEGSGNAESPQN